MSVYYACNVYDSYCTCSVSFFDTCRSATSACIKKKFNLPLTLNENTATVTRIADITSTEAFKGDAVVLLDSDSVGTRGMYNSRYYNGKDTYIPNLLRIGKFVF